MKLSSGYSIHDVGSCCADEVEVPDFQNQSNLESLIASLMFNETQSAQGEMILFVNQINGLWALREVGCSSNPLQAGIVCQRLSIYAIVDRKICMRLHIFWD